MDGLERRRTEPAESLQNAKKKWLDVSSVREYGNDLRGLLSKGSLVEQKTFLRSFIKRIELKLPK
jgi:hypothetical protein